MSQRFFINTFIRQDDEITHKDYPAKDESPSFTGCVINLKGAGTMTLHLPFGSRLKIDFPAEGTKP